MKKSYILALDTSGGACTAGVFDTCTNTVLASDYALMPYGQAVNIMPMVDRVVTTAGIDKAHISAIYTCNGPGYFTGIRIGLSTAQGLALGLGVPLYAISSLHAMAFQVLYTVPNINNITVIMESKRQDFYVQSFDGATATDDLCSLLAQDISPNPYIVGSGVKRYLQKIDTPTCTAIDCPPYPHADNIARGIYHLLQQGDTTAIYKGGPPLYLRPPDVQPPKSIYPCNKKLPT